MNKQWPASFQWRTDLEPKEKSVYGITAQVLEFGDGIKIVVSRDRKHRSGWHVYFHMWGEPVRVHSSTRHYDALQHFKDLLHRQVGRVQKLLRFHEEASMPIDPEDPDLIKYQARVARTALHDLRALAAEHKAQDARVPLWLYYAINHLEDAPVEPVEPTP